MPDYEAYAAILQAVYITRQESKEEVTNEDF